MSLFFELVCALSALSVTVHDCVTAVDIFEMKVKQHGNPSYPVKSARALYSRCREAEEAGHARLPKYWKKPLPLPLLVVKCSGFTIFLLTAVISAGEPENFNCGLSVCNRCNEGL
ncbi:hypothetical protein [Paraburkholderia sp. SIMBA_054]